MAYDLKSGSEVKDYLHNLGIEYRFGCYSEKKPEVCHLLGDYLEAVKKDFEKAGKVYKHNCDDFKFPRSCYSYGKYLMVGRGHVKENLSEAYKYFEKACSLNEADACLTQGLMLATKTSLSGIDKDAKKGMECLEKACNSNNAKACYYLSGMYISGVEKDDKNKNTTKKGSEPVYEVQKDMSKAYKYALQGCDLGNVYSCANLSQMYARGEGTEKNLELAEKYRKIAIDMQDELMNLKQTVTFQEGLSQ